MRARVSLSSVELKELPHRRHGNDELVLAEGLVRQRRRVHPADAARGRGVPVVSSYPRTRPCRALRQRGRRVCRAPRLVADARAGPPRGVARSAELRRADFRDVADCVLRDARRQSRCVLSETQPEPPDGLDSRCAAWSLQLCVACEAQRCPSHLHERRRLRRRHHPGAVRSAGARSGNAAVVPAAALLHLVALLRDGAPLADRRRCRRVRSGDIGTSALRLPRGWDLVGLVGGKVIFISWAIVAPMLVYPWWGVVLAYLVYSMVVSLIMAVTFQLAHCVEEA